MIEVINRQRLFPIDRSEIARLAAATIAALSREQMSAAIVFVRDPVMRSLNREYRNIDRATDVLSFPSRDEQTASESFGDALFLGDVVVSTDTALRQAQEAGHNVERELSELVIHGILHLCGYDHETDRGEMNRLELRLRRKLLSNH
ncbi:MAG TPA: rRNA maturation RNase YbeY [Blastocatellia bacterium]|nr:rRNA maturation RNase YbeY [Blastocatellia bacterium]